MTTSTPPHAPYLLPLLSRFGDAETLRALDPGRSPLAVYVYLLIHADWRTGVVQISRAAILRDFGFHRQTLWRRLRVLQGDNPLQQPYLYMRPAPWGRLRLVIAHQPDIQRAKALGRRAHLRIVRPQGAPAPTPEAPPVPHAADAALWQLALADLAGRMNAANYRTWFADTRPLGRRGTLLVIGAPTRYQVDGLGRFADLVRAVLVNLTSDLDGIAFAAAPAAEKES